jgi:hypothetical protein
MAVGLSKTAFASQASVPCPARSRASPLRERPVRAGSSVAWPVRELRLTCSIQPFGPSPQGRAPQATMPSADFCAAITRLAARSVRDSGRNADLPRRDRPPSPRTRRNLPHRPLPRTSRSSPRSSGRVGLIFGSCPSGRGFDPRFLRPRLAATPLRFARPSPSSGWAEDLHVQPVDHARHTERRASPNALTLAAMTALMPATPAHATPSAGRACRRSSRRCRRGLSGRRSGRRAHARRRRGSARARGCGRSL